MQPNEAKKTVAMLSTVGLIETSRMYGVRVHEDWDMETLKEILLLSMEKKTPLGVSLLQVSARMEGCPLPYESAVMVYETCRNAPESALAKEFSSQYGTLNFYRGLGPYLDLEQSPSFYKEKLDSPLSNIDKIDLSPSDFF